MSNRGFALIATLGLLVAFGTVGLTLGLQLRVTRIGVANAVEHARALEAAHAGVAHARSRLAELLRDGRLGRDRWAIADSTADTVYVGDAAAEVHVADLGTRLNLNVATEDQLRRLFVALRMDAGESDRLAQRIADWRDEDELRRRRGAEAPQYAKEGLPPPRNAPFERVTDLRDVLGMTDRYYARVRPYLTTRGTGRVNLNAAERPVLLALPGMSEEAVKILRDRRMGSRPITNVTELLQLLSSRGREALLPEAPSLEGKVVFETRELEIVSRSKLPGSPVHARVHAVLAGAGEHAVLVWRQAE
jgi:type II secretory pathway component PulK